MDRMLIKPVLGAALTCLSLAANAAWASTEAASGAPAKVDPAASVTTVATVAPVVLSAIEPRLGKSVSGEKLEAERGKAGTGSSEANLGGVVTGNSASNLTTGSNSIDTGSFANMSGLPVVIQNTGANVMIQNATVINVMFK